VPVTLWVNGARHRLQIEPRATLAQVLRTQLRLTGTKLGCDRGACTVLLDGIPLNS
jgi:xanthine dehydrogenase YagT iron-sulfur-binding subunit